MLNQYQPLFLKYRPQSISELVGQKQVALTLANAINYKRISHAYLFTGPRGTGKTSAARIFAKSLNCELGPTAEPCQKCISCLEIKQGISPSVFEIDAASNNSVDDARLLIERAPLAACGGRFKLYIIDECHMLTKEAFNALLKTIEEPPPNVIFILATTEEHKVLPTIVSRCQKLIFRLIEEQAMDTHLSQVAAKENIAIEPEALTAIARRANGGLRDALSLLDQVSLLSIDGQAISTQDVLMLTGSLPEDTLIALSTHILQKEGEKVLALLQELFVSGREAHLIASELAKHMLNVAKAGYWEADADDTADNKRGQTMTNISGSKTYKQALADLAKLTEPGELIQMIEEIDRLEVSCRRSGQPIMNLEIGLLSLCHRLDIFELKSIQARLQKLENTVGVKTKLAETGESKPTESKSIERKPSPIETKEPKPTVIKSDPEPARKPVEEFIDATETSPKPELLNEKLEDKPDGDPNKDIDLLWQNILAELQRRHLPTFSLVSTHAFPIEASAEALTIGVFVENFQKMIENKADYIKNAAIACKADPGITIRVKVTPGGRSLAPGTNNADTIKTAEQTKQASLSAKVSFSKEDYAHKENQTAVKEAYRLFEGPGSRYIAPSQ